MKYFQPIVVIVMMLLIFRFGASEDVKLTPQQCKAHCDDTLNQCYINTNFGKTKCEYMYNKQIKVLN